MKIVKFLAPLFILTIFLSLFFLGDRLIKIDHLSCRSQYGQCNSQLSDQIDKFAGKNLQETKSSLTKLLKADLSIENYNLHFNIPDKIVINIIEKKPKFAIKNLNNNFYALVDKNGYVIKIQDSNNLPLIEINERIPNVGEKVSVQDYFALNIISDLFQNYSVQKGKMENSGLVVELSPGLSVLFPLDGDKAVLLGSLKLILDRLKTDSKESTIKDADKIKIIDLRFQNPVLR